MGQFYFLEREVLLVCLCDGMAQQKQSEMERSGVRVVVIHDHVSIGIRGGSSPHK